MKALYGTDVPVPEVLVLCVDASVLGTPFYVMKYVRGRLFPNPKLPDMSSVERSAIYNEMARVLAAIHGLDLEKVGLSHFGHSKGYILRQVKRWHSQYEKSKTHEIPAMDKVAKWLEENAPKKEEISLIHGDFRLDNMIWHPTEPRVLAVLDWELSTIGNPYSDVAYNCMPYLLPDIGREGSAYSGFGSAYNWKASGIPDQPTYLSWYYQHRSCPPIEHFRFFQVFSVFRAASILQGVFKRSQLGNASSADASRVGAYAEHLANLAWEVATSPSLSPNAPIRSLLPTPPVQMTTSAADQASSSSAHSSASNDDSPAGNSTSGDLEGMFHFSPKYYELKAKLLKFMDDEIYPREKEFEHWESQLGADWTKWTPIPFMEEVKEKAKKLGLWNLWITAPSTLGAGLTNLEYAPLCAIMGRSVALAPTATNCAAPDTGNMEVLMRYGSDEQKKQWLEPLLRGEIRSAFAMTEPDVASSDATNISTEIIRDGNEYVVRGRKWWTSGAGRQDCKVLIVMGKSNPQAPPHKQQSMILVPIDTPGVTIVRPLPIFGYYDAPEGHMEVVFDNVRVPASNMLLGEGRGFEIAQGRLGPGRIHHCMRLIGIAERCLEVGTERALTRTAFKKPIALHGMSMNSIALSRIEIEQCRLLTYKAAYAMDTVGNKVAKDLIAMIKVAAPRMACTVIDRVIQLYGAAGLSNDFFVARAYANCRTFKFADGPDEVHIQQIAKLEYIKHREKAKAARAKL